MVSVLGVVDHGSLVKPMTINYTVVPKPIILEMIRSQSVHNDLLLIHLKIPLILLRMICKKIPYFQK
jgi:hypothetical protein